MSPSPGASGRVSCHVVPVVGLLLAQPPPLVLSSPARSGYSVRVPRKDWMPTARDTVSALALWILGNFYFPLSCGRLRIFFLARDCFIIRRKVILKKQKLPPNIPAAGAADEIRVPVSVPQGWLPLGGDGGCSEDRFRSPWGRCSPPRGLGAGWRWSSLPSLPIITSPWKTHGGFGVYPESTCPASILAA